ncbi:hypothetical protein Vadar_010020 [Vaccinium darrowii]|uniref:Uncharacterized protein n=1 Tax=Vaccinium darrowii TaxID=229202 RepID=A0ACB7Z5C7_9ERIC|nr:hypothetical protein Vadar_010020 [Vaccinium darrowii]
MYAQVPKWTLSPSPIPIPIPYPTRKHQASSKRTKNHVYDPKMEILGSNENNFPFNKTESNLPFSTGPMFPPRGMVRFNEHQYGGGGGSGSGGSETIGRKRVAGHAEAREVLSIAGPTGSRKSTLLDGLAGRQSGNISTKALASGTSVLERETIEEEIWKIGKRLMPKRIHKKPRFLCLHGFRTSAEVLQTQLRRWPEALLGKLDLVFPNGPFPAQGKSDVDGFYDPPFYEWFQYSEDYQKMYNFEEGVAYIEDFMIKHGPFDGLMGFSQGAVISAALPGMQLQGVALTKVPKIKYVIIMSGAKFGGSISKFYCPKLAANAFSSPIKCPSLHIIGEVDYFKEPGHELVESFVDPLVIHHSRGHTVARLG